MNGEREKSMTANGINVLAGIWLILAPFLLGYSGTPVSKNDITIGIIVGAIALIRMFMPASTAWMGWVNGVLGLWLLISPFTMSGTTTASIWNDIILGVVIIVMAIWSTSSSVQGHPKMG